MRLPFCILNVLGDVLADGELRFVEAARTLEAAKRRIKALAKLWPGQYVIYNEQTGERLSIIAGAKRRTSPLRGVGQYSHATKSEGASAAKPMRPLKLNRKVFYASRFNLA